MTIYVNQNGTWLEVEQPHVYDVSIWKQIKNQYVNDSGTWRIVHPNPGELFVWGSNTSNFLLGTVNSVSSTVKPTPVTTFAGTADWRQISIGQFNAGAIDISGYLWTWGNSGSGGQSIIRSVTTPVTIFGGGTNWADTSTASPTDLYTIATGRVHSVAIKTDGTLWVWGNKSALGLNSGRDGDYYYIIETPVTTFAGGTNWKSLSSTSSSFTSNTAAIKTDGTLWMWGGTVTLGDGTLRNISVPSTTFVGGTDWKQVSISNSSSGADGSPSDSQVAAIKTDGTLWTWGTLVSSGVLGRAWFEGRATPVTVFGGGTNWANPATTNPEDLFTITAGSLNGGAIKTDGTLWMWGANNASVLGNFRSQSVAAHTPITIWGGGTNWRSISSGYNYVGGIKTDGTLWMWGTHFSGTIGNGGNFSTSSGYGSYNTPVTVFGGGTNWRQISCGSNGSRFFSGTQYAKVGAIKTDGTLWMWGNRASGNLGDRSLSGHTSTPITVWGGGTDWRQVSCGRVTGAIKTDGTLWMWGLSTTNGLLANGLTTSVTRSTPVTVWGGGTNWKQISCGAQNNAAIKTDGTLWVWGANGRGELGINQTLSSAIYTPVTTFAGGTDWKQVFCGADVICAVKTNGTLWVWGNAQSGAGGNNNFSDSVAISTNNNPFLLNLSVPTQVGTATNWAQVVASNTQYGDDPRGFRKVVATKTDGTLWVWGLAGRMADAATTSFETGNRGSNIPINMSPSNNYEGLPKSLVPAALPGTGWSSVSTGGGAMSAIKTDGTLWVWGNNSVGRLSLTGINYDRATPTTTFIGGTNWKQVSVTTNSISAVKTDGTLWMVGSNTAGKLGIASLVGSTSTPVTTFAGGTDWKQVFSGADITCAVKTDGTLWTWGNNLSFTGIPESGLGGNRSTPITTFAGGTNWTQVSVSGTNTIALKTDGTLWAWGTNDNGQLTRPSLYSLLYPQRIDQNPDWKQFSFGVTQNCAAIKTDGTLWLWGVVSGGQLGTNDITPSRTTPVTTFAGGTNWKQVSCGYRSMMAIKTDGTLWGWGKSYSGSLGDSSIGNTYSIPITTFVGGTDWNQVSISGVAPGSSTGSNVSAAVKTNGTLWEWGRVYSGYTHAVNFLEKSTPVTTFAGGTNWKQVSCAAKFKAAVKTDGTLWTWGHDAEIGGSWTSRGIMGRLSAYPFRVTPSTIFGGGTNWANPATTNPEDLYTISAGDSHNCAIKTDGTLWGWGKTSYGLAKGSNLLTDLQSVTSTPVTVFGGGTNWKSVACGYETTMAIKTDGTLWVWGKETGGCLGDASPSRNVVTPVTTFAGGTNWKQVSANRSTLIKTAAAIKTDGTLWVWGNNLNSRGLGLGYKPLAVTSTPVTTFAGGTNWKQVSVGTMMAAIKTDGTLWLWGSNSYRELANLGGLAGYTTPITTFAGGTDWKQVSCGFFNVAAIKTDGTLWVWGNNTNGHAGNTLGGFGAHSISTPVTTFAGGTNWKQVSMGDRNCAAIKTDGTLWVWGNRTNGILGDTHFSSRQTGFDSPNFFTTICSTPITTFAGGTDWTQVYCGYRYTFAHKQNGQVYIWGDMINRPGIFTASNLAVPWIPGRVDGTDWKTVRCGHQQVVATKLDGTLWVWGNMNLAALGNNTNNSVQSAYTPITTFAGGTRWVIGDSSAPLTAAAIKKI